MFIEIWLEEEDEELFSFLGKENVRRKLFILVVLFLDFG